MKNFVLAVSVAFASCAASADVLLWRVNADDVGLAEGSYDGARVVAATGSPADGTALPLVYANGQGEWTSTPGLTIVGLSSAKGGTTGNVWSDLAPLAGLSPDYSGVSFYVELMNADNEVVRRSEGASYGSLASYVATANAGMTDEDLANITAWQPTFGVVPEPTSGLLLLLGLGALVLRRREKGLAAAVVCLALALPTVAAQNDILVTFSTPGPDTYADGTAVLDGERYALVWTAGGVPFAGLTDRGAPVRATDKVVVFAPVAKGGKCPTTLFEIDAALAADYAGGTFSLVLVDTRVRAADGSVALAAAVDGVPTVVNAAGTLAAGASAEKYDVAGGSALTTSGAVTLGSVGVLSEIANPRIVSIEVKDAKVQVRVEGLSPAADYFVTPVGTDGKSLPALEAARTGDVFTFDRPSSAGFFRVIGARRFEAK